MGVTSSGNDRYRHYMFVKIYARAATEKLTCGSGGRVVKKRRFSMAMSPWVVSWSAVLIGARVQTVLFVFAS